MESIKVIETICAAHRLVNYSGKCSYLHGHNFRITVEAEGTVQDGMFIADFGDIKEIIRELDHATIVWKEDKELLQALGCLSIKNVVKLPFESTAENISRYFALKILARFSNLDSVLVQVKETDKNEAACREKRSSLWSA